ncbi:MAG: 4Fe-4S binding protein [Proteobacteria bacterium]|nr:4Fe-4S binding protein [Pseudomonadota bacterium]
MGEHEHSIVIDEGKCIGCGICVNYCNVDAICINEEKGVVEVVDLDLCIECHSCQQMCPEQAIKVYPQIDEVLPKL